jgi:hypothetical protein
MERCDCCQAEFKFSQRRVAATPRPSDPTEIVAVMWGCGICTETRGWPKATAIYDAVENGREWEGRRYLFVSV